MTPTPVRPLLDLCSLQSELASERSALLSLAHAAERSTEQSAAALARRHELQRQVGREGGSGERSEGTSKDTICRQSTGMCQDALLWRICCRVG